MRVGNQAGEFVIPRPRVFVSKLSAFFFALDDAYYLARRQGPEQQVIPTNGVPLVEKVLN